MPTGYQLRERKSRFIRKLYPKPPQTVCPNMYVLDHANGCLFSPQCNYCYLKSTLGHMREHEAFTNVEQMAEEMRHWIARDDLDIYMLNAGTMSDSFSFEEVRPIVVQLVEVFRQYAKGRPHTLLFLTKGGRRECQPLYSIEPCENVIVSFSVTHPDAARRFEKGAATIEDRLGAARELKALGWRLRMRIDPMFKGYDHTAIAEEVKALEPERVTLGSLRADPNLYRFIHDGTLDELEPPPGEGRPGRYPFEERLALYQQATAVLNGAFPVALCEEEAPMWDALGLDKEARPCNCHV